MDRYQIRWLLSSAKVVKVEGVIPFPMPWILKDREILNKWRLSRQLSPWLEFKVFRGKMLHTLVTVVSTTHTSLKIQEQQFFGTFKNSCFNCLARPFFTCFCKTPCLSCSISFSSFLLRRLAFLISLRKR